MKLLDELKYDANGLIPAIVQETGTGRVLMMAWMNKDSLAETIKLKKTCFWSRSRKQYWVKGESSGHVQHVKNISFDCDKDCLLIEVEQIGAACHDGFKSCFYRTVEGDGFKETEKRLVDPEAVYGKK